MNKRIIVFFAWQSDLPNKTNRTAISQALRTAATAIEEQLASKEIHIMLDEAVRDEPGSPNIPETIRAKIESSDIFVCDITTINQQAPMGRKTPNPNVLFELGYAVAYLDWRRTIMLFNTVYGSIDDLPFDIDRQRIASYAFPQDAEDPKAARAQLSNLLTEAISLIIEKRPPKAVESRSLNPEVEKRRRDVETLHALLATIHWPTLDAILESAPKVLDRNVFHFWESFNGTIESSRFHLYDPELLNRVERFHRAWGAILSHSEHYELPKRSTNYVFTSPYHSSQGKKAWDDMTSELSELAAAKRELLGYIRSEYLEVNPDRLSQQAWKEYLDFHEEFHRKMDSE